MSSGIAGLFELHLADGALVVVIIHCQVSVGNHFGIILRLIRGLGLGLLGHLGLGSGPLALLGSRDLPLGLRRPALDKLAADG